MEGFRAVEEPALMSSGGKHHVRCQSGVTGVDSDPIIQHDADFLGMCSM